MGTALSLYVCLILGLKLLLAEMVLFMQVIRMVNYMQYMIWMETTTSVQLRPWDMILEMVSKHLWALLLACCLLHLVGVGSLHSSPNPKCHLMFELFNDCSKSRFYNISSSLIF